MTNIYGFVGIICILLLLIEVVNSFMSNRLIILRKSRLYGVINQDLYYNKKDYDLSNESSNIDIIPRHIAFIVDGNGRWAENRGLSRTEGHNAGANVTVEIVQSCFENGVEVVTLYLFSSENWKRPSKEVSNIMILLESYLKDFTGYLLENEISLKTIGQLSRLPKTTQLLLKDIERTSSAFKIPIKTTQDKKPKRVLCLALSYGGRDEIVQAAKELCKDVQKGRKNVNDIDEASFEEYLYTSQHKLPDPDVIVRTSESRLSNFLLWQSAYSEFISLPFYWPDFKPSTLDDIFSIYMSRHRRFGAIDVDVDAE